MAHFAQLDIGELGLDRAAPRHHVDVADRRAVDGAGGIVRQVGRRHLRRRLDQHPRHVDGDVAGADDDHARRVEIGRPVDEVGVGVVPVDEARGADDAGLVLARDAEQTVVGGADRQHDGVVHLAQLVEGERLADIDIAIEVDALVRSRARKAAHHVLGLLVIGRDPEANQAVGRRQPVDDIDPALRVRLQERVRRIESRRA